MKRVLLITLLTCFSIANLQAGNKVTICGQLDNFKNKTVFLGFIKNYLYYQKLNTSPVNSDREGNFCIRFPWDKPWPAFLFLGNQSISLFLSPGDSIVISGNASNPSKTFRYSGKGGKENQLLHDFNNAFTDKNLEFRKEMQKLGEKDFYIQNDKFSKEQRDFIQKYEDSISNRHFMAFIYAQAIYSGYSNIFIHAGMHGIKPDYDYITGMFEPGELNNDLALTSTVYIDFLFTYINYIAPFRAEESGEITNYWEFRYKLIRREFSGDVRDLLLARILKEAFEYTHNVTAVMLFNDYRNVYINPEYFQAIRNNFMQK